MAKESIYSIGKEPIFRETFNDQQAVERNGGISIDVSFSDGLAYFDGDASYVRGYYLSLTQSRKYSFRIRFKTTNITRESYGYLFGNDIAANFYIVYRNDGAIQLNGLSSISAYLNGVYKGSGISAGNILNNEWYDLVITATMTFSTAYNKIGINFANTGSELEGYVDFVEIYEGELTAEEVANLYTNSRYRELSFIGDEKFGSELNTNLNATSDLSGNETDATTGFSSIDLDVFQSQSSVVSVGSYAIEANSNGNPLSNARCYIDLDSAPFNLIDGNRYLISFDLRHIGTGGTWVVRLDSSDIGSSGNQVQIVGVTNSSLTYNSFEYQFMHSVNTRYFVIKEANISNDGGVYFDNLSVKLIEPNTGITKVLDLTAENGVIEDRVGNSFTNTDVDVVRDGQIDKMRFNGSTSFLNLGSILDLTGDIMINAWVKPKSLGGSNQGSIINNGKLRLEMITPNTFRFSSDAATFRTSSTSINFNIYTLITIRRFSSGNVDIFVNGVFSNTGTSGSVVVGDTDLFIGNRSAGNTSFDGSLCSIIILDNLLSDEQIAQYYNSTKFKYKG